MNLDITKHTSTVTNNDRENLIGQKSIVIWLTGLSGSGKSTIANELANQFHKMGKLSYILDGDNIRLGLNKDLGFSGNEIFISGIGTSRAQPTNFGAISA